MRTVDLIGKKQKASTLGPIIHNSQVVEKLKRSGIVAANLYDIKEVECHNQNSWCRI